MRRILWVGGCLVGAALGLRAADELDGARALKSGIDKRRFDSSIRPQDDLFRHVSGKWLASAEIPPDRSLDGAFPGLRDQSESNIHAIIEDAVKRNESSEGNSRKVCDFYSSFMDEAKVDALGYKPIEDELAVIDAITDKTAFIKTLAKLERIGTSGLFTIRVATDAKQSDRYILYLSQGGLGLPDESYYRDPKFQTVRDAYVEHIGAMFALARIADAKSAAKKIMAVESGLASHHWDRVKNRDATLTYNKKSGTAISELTPGFDWAVWFENVGAKGIDEVIVRQPSYFTAMAKSLEDQPLADWKLWLKWNLIRAHAPFLAREFAAEDFAFFGKTLTGAPEMRPRWKRAVSAVESALGEALGELYVAKHFPPAAKSRMKQLVANLIEAYRRDIQELPWMSGETKRKALEKLAKFTPKIGYPDVWRDYSSLTIRRDDLVGNVQRGEEFELARNLVKLGKPVDKREWGMTPQTVNAYYNPGMNEIVFPAAILQPPFFDLEADDAVNYGGIGAVIGHEIGHGFDDQGSKYDGDGNMQNWWTSEDRLEFEKRAKLLIEQYNGFEPPQLRGQHVNGALTIGENIGDLGGLAIAYKAYKIALGDSKAAVLDGFTGEQRFFIGWAQVWRAKYRDAEAMRRLAVDPHSPAEFRCNGVVRNLSEFHEAFNVKEGDKLWLPPRQRVRIW
jgi:putative endopeptidase